MTILGCIGGMRGEDPDAPYYILSKCPHVSTMCLALHGHSIALGVPVPQVDVHCLQASYMMPAPIDFTSDGSHAASFSASSSIQDRQADVGFMRPHAYTHALNGYTAVVGATQKNMSVLLPSLCSIHHLFAL